MRISTGCLDACSFCAINKATGRLKSKNPHQIIQELGHVTGKDIKAVYFLGEDVGAYGHDIGTDIFLLIREVLKQFPSTKFHLGSINPRHIIKETRKFIELFEHSSVEKRISMPVQSGSDRILKLMNRQYCIHEYLETVYSVLDKINDIEIATDFIVGFPSESESDFEATIDLLEKIDFTYVDCFRFDSQQNTPGSILKNQLPEGLINERHRALCFKIIKKLIKKKGIKNENSLSLFLKDKDNQLSLNTNSIFNVI